MEQEPPFQEKGVNQEQPSEIRILTEQEKEDMRWHTAKKGWNFYWAERFTNQPNTFPENIVFVADKILKRKKYDSEAMIDFQRYINAKLCDLYKNFPEETIVIKEEDKSLKEEVASFDSFLEVIEKAQFQILDQKLLPAMSLSEKQELETDPHKKGAVKWWLTHLLPETDIVREDVKNVLDFELRNSF